MANETTNRKMKLGEIGAMIQNIKNILEKLNETAGPIVADELMMRLIGQHSESVRNKLKEKKAAAKKGEKVNRRRDYSYEYKNCNLSLLDEAIIEVFSNNLTDEEREKLEKFRSIRNKFIHADFVNLMELIAIAPTGREIISRNGTRNILQDDDIKEAIMSLDRNQGFEQTKKLANEVRIILEKIIWTLCNE